MDKDFDVVLFGVRVGMDMQSVAQGMAEAFSISPEQALSLLQHKGAVVFKKALPSPEAKAAQQTLNYLGVKSNIRPTNTSGITLSLVPKMTVFSCPNCGHRMEWDENDPEGKHPDICPQCHIVFAKHAANQDRIEEEKALRERLRKMAALRDEEEQRKAEEAAEEARKAQLEAQIRKQLGLPTALDRPWKLWSSAAATLVFGAAIGGGGAALFLAEGGRLEPDPAAPGVMAAGLTLEQSLELLDGVMPMAAAQQAGLGEDQLARFELQSLSQQIIEQAPAPLPAPSPAVTGSTDAVPGAPARADSPSVSQSLASLGATDPVRALQALTEEDREWDLYLQQQVLASLERTGSADRAERLAGHIRDPELRAETRARILVLSASQGRVSEADSLLGRYIMELDQRETGERRIALAARMAPILAQASTPAGIERLLTQVMAWSGELTEPGERASAWAWMAWAQAHLGQAEAADKNLRRAIITLREPLPAEVRLGINAHLAETFAQLGALEDAYRLLDENEAQARALPDTERDRALAAVARAWFAIGNPQRALGASQAFASQAQRDRFLFEQLQRRAYAGDFFGLPSIAGLILNPATQAQALLGATSPEPIDAKSYFQRAIALCDGLKDAREKALTRAEIARLLKRANYRQSAERLFEQSAGEVAALAQGGARDFGWAALIAQRARALELAAAQESLDKIGLPALIEAARQDLGQVAEALVALRAASS
ncbi:MAG: hypothetical protein JXM75_09505 [Chromatiaceae bacterium]|nr:hypothetical protein [Chromatiaceae bacterium]